MARVWGHSLGVLGVLALAFGLYHHHQHFAAFAFCGGGVMVYLGLMELRCCGRGRKQK